MHNDETVDLLGYLRRLTRYWIPALAVALLALVAMTLLGMRSAAAPVSHAKAHVLVEPQKAADSAEADLQTQLLPQLMRTYVALDTTPTFLDATAQKLGGKFTTEDLGQRVKIYWGGGSMLLAVQADAPTDQEAIDIANAGAQALVEKGGALLGNSPRTPRLTLVEKGFVDPQEAAANAAPSKFSGVKNGVVAGIALGLLTAVVLEWRGSRRRRAVSR